METLNAGLEPVTPVMPPAPYQGGKRYLARHIIERLAAVPHITYAEPFTGMGGVFLRRPFRARAEVVNDASRDVANLFRMLQRHYQALMDMLRWQLTSRIEFDRLRQAEADTLTDLERAARFLYLQRLAFGGKIVGRNFGTSPGLPARFDVAKLAPMLAEIHDRLSGVVIECLPYLELIRRYDRPDTLFYLDPPYVGCEQQSAPGCSLPRTKSALPSSCARFAARSCSRSTTIHSCTKSSPGSRSNASAPSTTSPARASGWARC